MTEQILNGYYANNAQKLHEMVDKILCGFGGIADKDRDDFYSLANEVFTDVMNRYDNIQPFDRFLYSCLCNKIKSEMTKRNRFKRQSDKMSVSIYAPVGGDEDVTIGDMLAAPFDVERFVLGEDNALQPKIEAYLNRLSSCQREIVQLLSESYTSGEIQQRLHMTQKEYADAMIGIHSYENIKVLLG